MKILNPLAFGLPATVPWPAISISHFCAEHCCVEHYHHSHDSICYVLLVVFCCSLYPQQVQTRMKQVDKKRFRKQVKMVQNWLEELPKSRLGDSWGPSWPQDSFGQQKWCFWAAPGPLRRNPFGSLFGSCCHPEAPWGWKLRILGGSGCRVFFWRDFASFLEGSWAVKTLILHGRGSKNHNFTEVRILLLFGSIWGVILEPKSL